MDVQHDVQQELEAFVQRRIAAWEAENPKLEPDLYRLEKPEPKAVRTASQLFVLELNRKSTAVKISVIKQSSVFEITLDLGELSRLLDTLRDLEADVQTFLEERELRKQPQSNWYTRRREFENRVRAEFLAKQPDSVKS